MEPIRLLALYYHAQVVRICAIANQCRKEEKESTAKMLSSSFSVLIKSIDEFGDQFEPLQSNLEFLNAVHPSARFLRRVFDTVEFLLNESGQLFVDIRNVNSEQSLLEAGLILAKAEELKDTMEGGFLGLLSTRLKSTATCMEDVARELQESIEEAQSEGKMSNAIKNYYVSFRKRLVLLENLTLAIDKKRVKLWREDGRLRPSFQSMDQIIDILDRIESSVDNIVSDVELLEEDCSTVADLDDEDDMELIEECQSLCKIVRNIREDKDQFTIWVDAWLSAFLKLAERS